MKTLCLYPEVASATSIRERVHLSTLDFLKDSLPSALVHKSVDWAALTQRVLQEEISVVIALSAHLTAPTALMIKGTGAVLIGIGHNPALADFMDLWIDPLSPPVRGGFTGPTYLLTHILSQVPAEEIAALLKMEAGELVEEVNLNQAERDLPGIATLFKKLDWDSDFFGVNIGYVSCRRLTAPIQGLVKKFVQRERVAVIEYLCDCHDRESVRVAETSGYAFVDMRLTFERSLERAPELARLPAGFSVRKAVPADIPRLEEISGGQYLDSRYYFDGHFDNAKLIEFYRGWITKAVLGQFDDYAYVLCESNKPVGFCSIREHKARSAKIGLFGIDRDYQGKGLASRLLEAVLTDLRDRGKNHVEVVTQGRNYGAQRAYQKSGFVTQKTELWYHKWLH